MAYTLEKQGDPYAAKLETLYFSMPATSGKGWTAQPMKLVDDNVWYIRVKLNDVASQRFRFDITGQGTKGQGMVTRTRTASLMWAVLRLPNQEKAISSSSSTTRA